MLQSRLLFHTQRPLANHKAPHQQVVLPPRGGQECSLCTDAEKIEEWRAFSPPHSSKVGVVDYESQYNEGNYPEKRERVWSFGEESALQISWALSVCDPQGRGEEEVDRLC